MRRRLLTASLLLASIPAFADEPAAAPPPNLQDIAARLQRLEVLLGSDGPEATGQSLADLDQRLRVIERKLENQQEEATAKAASTPVITVNEKGVSAKSPSGDIEVKLRGLVQADQRLYSGDARMPTNDSFLFRVIRPTLEGSYGSLLAFRLSPEFAGDSATIVDAYVDLRFDPAYTVRLGKFTSPVGLERLQSSASLSMTERGFPSELAPNRDIGVQLQGELAAGRVTYAAGVFNGTVDGRDATASDVDNHFEFAGRVFVEPWKNDANALTGLGFGIGASVGDKQGAGSNFLPRYRTPGQNPFFTYRATVLADGSNRRFSPQAYYYRNSFGLLAEAIRSSQEVSLAGSPGSRVDLSNRAWQATSSWVLTGEDAGYKGVVKPMHPFVLGGDGWGAFELVVRYDELDIDDDAFPIYADAAISAHHARAWGLGLNWYLNQNLKLVFNHTQTRFDGGSPLAADREEEKTFFSRIQVSF